MIAQHLVSMFAVGLETLRWKGGKETEIIRLMENSTWGKCPSELLESIDNMCAS